MKHVAIINTDQYGEYVDQLVATGMEEVVSVHPLGNGSRLQVFTAPTRRGLPVKHLKALETREAWGFVEEVEQ